MSTQANSSTILELKSTIESKLNEPLPPFVYSILLATRLALIANRLEAILSNTREVTAQGLYSAALAEIEGIRAIAKVIEESELRV